MTAQQIRVMKTYSDDFEKIYPLLLVFNAPFSREHWQRIFTYQWDDAQDHIGYHLEKRGEIVGFMGLIFSCRHKKNHTYHFCNITSLIVKPEYRVATFLLIRKLATYKDIIFTATSLIEESFRLFITIGFSPFETNYKILPVMNTFICKKINASIYISKAILEKLDIENQRIFKDHENLNCENIGFEYNKEICLLIYSVITQKHYGVSIIKIHIHYISNLQFFNKQLTFILHVFKEKFGLFAAIYVDKRFVQKSGCIFSFNKKIKIPKVCNNKQIDQLDIDSLYSETILL